jgi:hypothetical protein
MTHRPLIVLACLFAAELAMPTHAQNALGDGRGLERNAKRYPQTDQPKGGRDFAAEVRFRNSIVTGNAPGGLSFRGGSPYTSPSGFRAITSADDLYAFRRDSFFSGLSGQGIRGTEALQYQFSMTTGSAAPKGISGTLGVARSGGAEATLARDLSPAAAPRSDVHGGDWLRSTSSYASTRSLRPMTLGELPRDDRSFYRLMTSPLLGLRVRQVTVPRPDAALVAPTTPTIPSTPSNRSETTPANPNAINNEVGTPQRTRTPQDDLFDRFKQWRRAGDPAPAPKPAPSIPAPTTPDTTKPVVPPPAEADPEKIESWERRLIALRRHLLGLPSREVTEADKDPLTPDDRTDALNPDTITMLRESTVKAPRFIEVPDAKVSLSLYEKAMVAGQSAMKEKRYFDAEDRFSRALAAKRRDPVAQAARIHAQLGAGMFLSASVNLREWVLINPDAAAIRYGSDSLPAPERLTDIVAQFRQRLADSEYTDILSRSLGRRETGFILAYLGHQMGDESVIKDGLAAVTGLPSENDDDRMSERIVAYLRALWLGETPPPLPAVDTPKSEVPATEEPKPDQPKPDAPAK